MVNKVIKLKEDYDDVRLVPIEQFLLAFSLSNYRESQRIANIVQSKVLDCSESYHIKTTWDLFKLINTRYIRGVGNACISQLNHAFEDLGFSIDGIRCIRYNEILKINSTVLSSVDERTEQARKIKAEYEKDFDWEKHHSELESIIIDILKENSYNELAEIFQSIPSY